MKLSDVFTAEAIALNYTNAASNAIPYLGTGFFPSQKKAGLDLKWIKGHNGLAVSLMPSTFDAKSTFRDRVGISMSETEMPFFRESMLVKEKDEQEIMRVQDSKDPYAAQVLDNIFNDTKTLVDGANVVPERMIMQLLAPLNGSVGIEIKANNVDYTYNYDPDGSWKAEHYAKITTDADKWSTSATCDPLFDIETALDAQEAASGNRPEILLMSKATFNMIKNSAKVRSGILAQNTTANVNYTSAKVKQYVEEELSVTIIIYNKQFKNESGTAKKWSEGKLTSQDRVLIMQAPIDRALHGAEVIHLDRMYKIDSELKSSSEQATESVKKFSGITESIERFDERIAALKDNIKSFGSTIAHPLSTVKNGFSSIKNEISETASKIKNLAQTKMSNLTSNIKEMYSTLSRGQTGAKGFVTALKSIGKVGFEKTISGFQSIKKSIKSITFDKIKSGLSSIKSGTSSVLSGFKSLGSGAQKVASNIKTAFSNVGSKIKSVASNISSAADSITSKLFNIKSLVAGVATGAVVQQSVGIVVDRQNITSQFEVLLGSAEKANERVSELTDFAGMTPFTRDEIFAASKQLQVFTGDALSTGDSLRIIGDVAAGTGQQFEDVALWTGRLYDAMKSGRTVGEMTSRLQEMGAISGEDRTKIEKLAESGEDITQTWTEVEKIFSRYDGTMEKLSNNLGNMLTSLKSFATNSIFLPLGEGIASGLQPAIQKFRDFRKSNKEDVTAMGEVINNFAEKICVPLFNKIEQGAEFAIKAIASLKDGMSGLNKLKGTSPLLDKLIEAINFVVSHKETFIGAAKGIAAAMGGIVAAGKFTKIISALSGLLNPLTLVTAAFGILFNALKNDSVNGGTALTDLKNIAVTVFDSIKNAISTFSEIISNNRGLFSDIINTIVDLLPSLAEAFGEVLTAGLELAAVALPVLLDVFRELFEAVKPLLKQLPDLIKFIAKIIKACAKADVIEALAKGFIAYKVAVAAVNTVTKVHNTLLVLQAAKTKIAAAATKLFNLAMNSNPIIKVVSAIGLLVGGLTLLSKKFSKGKDDTDMLKQHIDEVTGSIHSMRYAFDNAKVTLPDINKTISANGYFMSDIDTQIADKEKQITDALTTAMRDQKGVRDEDLENIRGYMQELQMLEDDKLSIYREQQMSQFTTLDLKLKSGNLDQQGIADLLISTDEAYDQSISAIKEEFEGRQATINSLYAVERKSIVENENLTGQAKSEALKQWQARKDNELLESMRQENELLAESAKSRDYTYNQALEQSNKLVEKADFNFDILKQKSDSYKKDLDIMDKTIADTSASGIQKYNEASANADLMVKDITNMFLNLDNQSAQSLNNYFMTLNEAKNKGVTVSDDLKQQADTILTPFENLPPELQETGKQILAGLLQGMTDENGNVIDTTNMTCQELVEAAREAFDVHSPSRVFAEIGTNIGLGLLQGISLIMPVVTAAVTTNMMGLVTSASGFNLDSMGESAENISETVILAFSNMNKVSCQHMSGMQKSVVLISKLMSTTVIINLKTMSVQAVIIV